MRILELTLHGVDLEALRQFYVGFLGLRELEPRETGRLAVLAGRTRLFFIPAPRDLRPRYHFAFDVPPRRLEAAVRWLRERRGLLASPTGETRFHSNTWNADMVYFTDPQGNILEFIARHDAGPGPNGASLNDAIPSEPQREKPFSASEIVAITEIGLATDSVANTVGALAERLPGLSPYPDAEAAPGDDFAAMGDVNGLLIVVRRGRIWFPETGVPADFLPLDLLAELPEGGRYRLSAPPFPFATQPET
jgi:catechol-2,3-dioxygenase